MEDVETGEEIEEPRPVEVYDNGGETTDRYTVRIGDSIFGMSSSPGSPRGVNLYAGQVSQLPNYKQGEKLELQDCPRAVLVGIIGRLQDWIDGMNLNRSYREPERLPVWVQNQPPGAGMDMTEKYLEAAGIPYKVNNDGMPTIPAEWFEAAQQAVKAAGHGEGRANEELSPPLLMWFEEAADNVEAVGFWRENREPDK